MIRRQVLIILAVCWQSSVIVPIQAITLSSTAREQLVIDDDAISKLSEIFDIPSLKRGRTTFMAVNTSADSSQPWSTVTETVVETGKDLPEPPEYMVNLFNTIADRNGVMRIPNPYHANLIKSFPNKDLINPEGLHFDVTSVHFRETILQAELHLDLTPIIANLSSESLVQQSVINMSTIASVPVATTAATQDHLFIHVYLIESLFPLRKRLIAKKSLVMASAGYHSWTAAGGHLAEVVTVRPAVLEWINRPHHNYGLHVSIVSTVKDVTGREVRFEMSKQHHRLPVLILFMDDGRPERNPKYRIKSSAKQNEYIKNRLTRLGQAELYNSYTSADQLDASLPIRPSASQDLDSQDIFRIFPLASAGNRVKRSQKTPSKKPKEPSLAKRPNKAKKYRRKGQTLRRLVGGSCRRHELYVSFEEIGWSSWIISPKGFQAFHCRGDCYFPIGQESKPSNHATVISIINHLNLHKNVAAPCCVPEKLYSISLLYFDNEQNVILKQYDDMVAQSCACR